MARKKSLTDKMKSFAVTYIANKGNIQATAEQIGVSNKTAYGYMKNELVIGEIESLMKVVAVDTVRSAVQLQKELNNMLSDEYKEEVYDFKSGKIVHVKPRLADKVKAIELLGKFGGHFVNKHEINAPTLITIDIVDDEEDVITFIEADYVEV
ncbi:terminase small subunit [Fictibacillus sp. 5RED26]|uniref:terminase small subunit n=1 Tax=Fictibacillus sp. 5RED26 TaxID=2745876 RepID=UPI0018CFE899|nr:terminase small subunit [Fictibacillus sp. 5RED26]MBH0156168.1 terminase small subunit [Fictibacillus sp. 5RED26]